MSGVLGIQTVNWSMLSGNWVEYLGIYITNFKPIKIFKTNLKPVPYPSGLGNTRPNYIGFRVFHGVWVPLLSLWMHMSIKLLSSPCLPGGAFDNRTSSICFCMPVTLSTTTTNTLSSFVNLHFRSCQFLYNTIAQSDC